MQMSSDVLVWVMNTVSFLLGYEGTGFELDYGVKYLGI